MQKDLDAFYTALNNLFKEYGVESYMLSFGIDGEWHQIMKSTKNE